MANLFRIGVIGFAHMHVNHLVERFAAHTQAELAACADTAPLVPELRTAHYTRGWNLRHALEDLGVPRAFDDYKEMLDQEELDIVICCSENAQHPAVVEACAQKGVHVLIEKPMASSLQDGLKHGPLRPRGRHRADRQLADHVATRLPQGQGVG